MADKIKWMKTLLDKILYPLIVIAIVAIFGAYSRLQAVESDVKTLKSALEEYGADLKVLRCLNGDKITCRVIGMERHDR